MYRADGKNIKMICKFAVKCFLNNGLFRRENNINTDLTPAKYESKGFYPNVLVNDFPVRGKRLLLNIRRRRWVDKETGKYIGRDFHLIAEGHVLRKNLRLF